MEHRKWATVSDREIYEGYQTEHLVGHAKEARYLANYLKQSEKARAKWGDPLVVQYGKPHTEVLRIFKPKIVVPGPTVIFYRGGFWRLPGTINGNYWTDFPANGLLPHGITFVNVDFPVLPEVSMTDVASATRRALSFAIRNSTELGLNQNDLHVVGHSAGSHLGAKLFSAERDSLDKDAIKSFTGISGIYDIGFAPRSHLTRGENAIEIGFDDVENFRPAFQKPATNGRVVFVVGDMESDEFNWQTAFINQKWRNSGVDTHAYVMHDSDHYSLFNQLNDPQSPLVRLLVEQCQSTAP